jgi:hypothetical protein
MVNDEIEGYFSQSMSMTVWQVRGNVWKRRDHAKVYHKSNFHEKWVELNFSDNQMLISDTNNEKGFQKGKKICLQDIAAYDSIEQATPVDNYSSGIKVGPTDTSCHF